MDHTNNAAAHSGRLMFVPIKTEFWISLRCRVLVEMIFNAFIFIPFHPPPSFFCLPLTSPFVCCVVTHLITYWLSVLSRNYLLFYHLFDQPFIFCLVTSLIAPFVGCLVTPLITPLVSCLVTPLIAPLLAVLSPLCMHLLHGICFTGCFQRGTQHGGQQTDGATPSLRPEPVPPGRLPPTATGWLPPCATGWLPPSGSGL